MYSYSSHVYVFLVSLDNSIKSNLPHEKIFTKFIYIVVPNILKNVNGE